MISSPVKIKDMPNKIETTRAELMEEESGKIIGRKGMIFNSFQTEKQRLDDYMTKMNFTKAYNNRARKEHDLITEKERQEHLKSIIQPKMRFKARTDLERIFDIINKNSFGKMNKNVLDTNLKNLDPDIERKKVQKKLKEEGNIDADNNKLGVKLEKKKLKNNPNVIQVRNRMKTRYVDNTGAKLLMKDLYNKTHLKAASSLLC